MYDHLVLHVRSWLVSLALLPGCGRLIGIEDFAVGDAGGFDTQPPPGDVRFDAPPFDAPPFGALNAYVKASNTDAADAFGASLALSSDGTTLVIGAPGEDSAAISIGGDQASDAAGDAGAVFVFVRSATGWTQQAYLKPANASGTANDRFGHAVAVSADGSTVAVGAIGEDSSSSGINPTPNNNAGSAGAVYVFARTDATWAQQGFLKASNADGDDQFGFSVALAGDGGTLAVGARNEDSSATTINGAQTDENPQIGVDYGATYVFVRAGASWLQQAYVKASNASGADVFGTAVALSFDGDTLAVGTPNQDSSATGINGNATDQSANQAGAAYVFRRNSGIWAQQAFVKASNTGSGDDFGGALALSGDGNTLAVGAIGEDSSSTGVDGASNNNAGGSGAVYVYAQVAETWAQQAYVKASNTGATDNFGAALALTADGGVLLVGAPREDSSALGQDGNAQDNTASNAGAAYAFARTGVTWQQSYYLKAFNTEAEDGFGAAVAVAAGMFVCGAALEDSDATGVGGVASNNLAANAGAVYVTQ